MISVPHYLDYNATAPLLPEVRQILAELSAYPLNASSVHAAGRKARSMVEEARRIIAEAIGAFPSEIVFTTSGTESNNWVFGALPHQPVLASFIEHPSVLRSVEAKGQATLIPVLASGLVNIERLEAMLPEPPFLVSLMLANNETGVVQPVEEAARLAHAKGGLLHCDAVQALGKIPLDFTSLGCDFLTLSAHKMGGPAGAAALVIRNGLSLAPLLKGGGQEMNRRAGTENVAAIAGFGKAVAKMDFVHMRALRGWLDEMEGRLIGLAGEKACIFGQDAPRLPNTSLIAMQGAASQTQLIHCDLAGIAVSAGSACSSGRVEASSVLRAMGVTEALAGAALRVSGGWNTSRKDVEAFEAAWRKLFHSRR